MKSIALTFLCWTALAGCLQAASGPALFNVKDYGASGDGEHLETDAINAAINACVAAGGGTVNVPPGKYLTGTVVLKSHVALQLEAGATLLGSEIQRITR